MSSNIDILVHCLLLFCASEENESVGGNAEDDEVAVEHNQGLDSAPPGGKDTQPPNDPSSDASSGGIREKRRSPTIAAKELVDITKKLATIFEEAENNRATRFVHAEERAERRELEQSRRSA